MGPENKLQRQKKGPWSLGKTKTKKTRPGDVWGEGDIRGLNGNGKNTIKKKKENGSGGSRRGKGAGMLKKERERAIKPGEGAIGG